MPNLPATNRTTQNLILIAAVLGITLRLCCLFLFEYGIYSDAEEFRAIAHNLLAGKGFSLQGEATAYRMPGYPLFLTVLYHLCNSDTAVKLVQILIEMATGFVLFLFARMHSGRKEAAIAFSIWALLPVSIIQPLTLMSEGLFTLLLILQLFILSMPRNRYTTATAGLLNGMGVLIKPFMLLFPLAFALHHWFRHTCRRKILLHTILYTAITIGCLLPWLIRNHQTFGTMLISTNGGQNLYIGNNPDATGTYYDINPALYPADSDEATIDRDLKKKAIAFITNNPVAAVKTIPKKIAFLFSLESPAAIALHNRGTIPPGMSFRDAYRQTPFWMLVVINLPYIIITLAAVAGFILPAQSVPALRLPGIVILFWVGIHMIYFGAARFHYPLLPLFTIATATLPFTAKTFSKKRLHTVCAAVAGLFFCALWSVEIATVFMRH